MKKTPLYLLTSLFILGCGDDPSSSGDIESSDSYMSGNAVETKYELGSCTASNAGDYVYVRNENAYYVCSDSWYREDKLSSSSKKNNSNPSSSSFSYSSTLSSAQSSSSTASSSDSKPESSESAKDTTVSDIWNGKTAAPETEYKDGKYYMIIRTAEELAYFANQVNNQGETSLNARLEKNIRLNSDDIIDEDGVLQVDDSDLREWEPIGNNSNKLYKGVFDGNGHTISGIYINKPTMERVGLFGTLGGTSSSDSAFVSKLGIVNSYIVGGEYTGGIAGRINRVIISQTFTRQSYIKGARAGGVCGYQNSGKIENSYNNAQIVGSAYAGGISGYKYGGTVTASYNVGFLIAPSGKAGGISYSGNSTNSFYATQDDVTLVENGATEKDPYYMEGSSFAYTLNGLSTSDVWKYDSQINDGYPVFTWEK